MEEQRMMKESKREKHNYMDDNEATTTGTERNFSIVVLVTCFICQALSMGFYVSFGTLFVAIVEEFETTETKAAWVGSIGLGVCFMLGTISSHFSTKLGAGMMISIGGIFLGSGLLLSSAATNITSITITFGVVTSIGCSFLFFASLSCLPKYFSGKLCVAGSVICSGSNFSGFTFSPLIAYLVKRHSLRTCLQLFSTTALLPIIGGAVIHKYSTSKKTERRVDNNNNNNNNNKSYWKLLTNREFLLVLLTISLIELCYFIPYIHLVNFAINNGIALQQASWLPVILSIGGWCGKLIFGMMGQHKQTNLIRLFQLILLGMAISLCILPFASSFKHLVIFAIVYGIFDGGFAGFVLPVVAATVPSEDVNMAIGTLYTAISVELLFGAPLAGFLHISTESYETPFVMCSAVFVTSSVILFCVHGNQRNGTSKKKIPIFNRFQKYLSKLRRKRNNGANISLLQAPKMRCESRGNDEQGKFLQKQLQKDTVGIRSCDKRHEDENNGRIKQSFANPENVCVDTSVEIKIIETSGTVKPSDFRHLAIFIHGYFDILQRIMMTIGKGRWSEQPIVTSSSMVTAC